MCIFWLLGRSTSFQMPISVRPSNSFVDVTCHFSLSGEFIASQSEFGTSWNTCINALLIFPVDGPACGCLCCCSFVGRNEYWGAVGCNGAVPVSDGSSAFEPRGTLGCWEGDRGPAPWDGITGCPNTGWPRLGGLGGGWARLTRSSPNESDSLSDSGNYWSLYGTIVGCANLVSFTGNRVSSNFPSWEILKHWRAASQNWYPLEPGSYLTKIISQLFCLSLCLLFFSMCTQAWQLKTRRCEISGLVPNQSSFSVL